MVRRSHPTCHVAEETLGTIVGPVVNHPIGITARPPTGCPIGIRSTSCPVLYKASVVHVPTVTVSRSTLVPVGGYAGPTVSIPRSVPTLT